MRPSFYPSLCGLLALLVALSPLACTRNPVTGRNQIVLMDDEDDRESDRQGALAVEAQIGLVEDEELAAYVDELGQAMAKHSPRQNVRYHFHVVAMDEPNAFALPGGHIYVSRGLLALTNSEAELANVLGHEIGHVAARHAAQRDALEKLMSVMTVVGYAAAAAGGATNNGNGGPAGTPGIYKYSRDQESEADRIGQDLAVMAGVDPAGMADFMRSLDSATRLQMGFSRETGYFDTHPATRERAAEAATHAQVMNWEPKLKIARDRRDFLDRMSGLSVGPDAAEGVIRDGYFLHADFGVSVRFPPGWEIVNTRSAVLGISPTRDAMVVLELQGPGDDPRAAATGYARIQRVPLRDEAATEVNGLDAYRAKSELATPMGSRSADITWIAHGGMIYRLSGFAAKSRGAYAGIFRSFPRGFRAITEEELAQVDDLRLRVVEARAGETLAQLSDRTGNAWELNETAVANRIHLDERFDEGELVKITVRQPYVPEGRGAEPSTHRPDDDEAAEPDDRDPEREHDKEEAAHFRSNSLH
ncbi:MAG: M48 family metalloprotease [Deltaproteobacteria bacterium]|nr:M48 family metalloprotease [Deltaproteobacteria bacterium]